MFPFLIIIVSPALVVGRSAASGTDRLGVGHEQDFFYGIAEKRAKARIGQVAVKFGARDIHVILPEGDADGLMRIFLICHSCIDIASTQSFRELRPVMGDGTCIEYRSTKVCLLQLMRSQPIAVLFLAVLPRHVQSIFFGQGTAYTRTAVSLATVRNHAAVVVHKIIHHMAMGMSCVMVAGDDVLCVDDAHTLHPFLGNLCHQDIAFLVFGQSAEVSRRKGKRDVFDG